MNNEQRIKKIEELAAAFQPMLEKHDLPRLHLMSNGEAFKNVPAQEFIELCEHYKSEPFVSSYPTVWLKVGTVEVYVECERIKEKQPYAPDAVNRLKELINAAE